jgi:hypothetical protein
MELAGWLVSLGLSDHTYILPEAIGVDLQYQI